MLPANLSWANWLAHLLQIVQLLCLLLWMFVVSIMCYGMLSQSTSCSRRKYKSTLIMIMIMINLLKTFSALHICFTYNYKNAYQGNTLELYNCYSIRIEGKLNDIYISWVEQSTSLCVALYELNGQTNNR